MKHRALFVLIVSLIPLTAGSARGQRPATILTGAETWRGIGRNVGLIVAANRETPLNVAQVRDTVARLLRAGGFTILGDDPSDPANYPLVQLNLDTSVLMRGGSRQWITTYVFTVRQRLTSPTRQNVRFAAPTYVLVGWTYIGALQLHTILEAAHEQTSNFITEFHEVNPPRAPQRPPATPSTPGSTSDGAARPGRRPGRQEPARPRRQAGPAAKHGGRVRRAGRAVWRSRGVYPRLARAGARHSSTARVC